jgi:hypothetical protein
VLFPCICVLHPQLVHLYQCPRVPGALGWHQWGEGVRGQEDERGANNVYTCMQMQKWYLLKLFQEWGGKREQWRG